MLIFLLGGSIYSFSDFEIVIAILCDFVGEVVVFGDVVREVTEFELHVFESLHRCVEIEVFDVDGCELGARGGDSAIGKDFDGEEVYN